MSASGRGSADALRPGADRRPIVTASPRAPSTRQVQAAGSAPGRQHDSASVITNAADGTCPARRPRHWHRASQERQATSAGVRKGHRRGTNVRFWQILLQESNIEQPKGSRESRSRGISAAASLVSVTTEVRDQSWMKRYGPLRRCAESASTALGIFVRHLKMDFCSNIGTFRISECRG